MNQSIACPPIAGRLAHFQCNWEILAQDQWVLQTVAGYQLELLAIPHQTTYPHPMNGSKEEQAQITREVAELLSKGAIQEAQLLPESFVSQIFLIEKKDGGQRPVVNLKCLNQFMRVEHFKMEGLHLLQDLIQPGDWMIKLDQKDAYLQVPIHPDHQKFLVFEWNNLFYQFKCLSFRLSLALSGFTKLLRPVVGFLRQVGCRLIIYLDDILLLHQDREQLFNISQPVVSVPGTTVQREVLANPLPTYGIFRLPPMLPVITDISPGRENEQDATKILSQGQVTVREPARFIGKAVATVRALPLAPLHYRALQFQMNAILPAPYQGARLPGHEKYNTRVLLDETSRADLRWWKLLDRRRSGSPIRPAKPTVMMESDA